MLRSIEAIRQTMGTFESSECRMLLDGEDISGAYLLVEALNTPAFGPRIKVAPEADPSDGLLEVLRIRDDVRPGFLRYLTGLLREELEEPPTVEVNQGSRLEIFWNGFPIHVDGEVRPADVEPPDDREPVSPVSPQPDGGNGSTICVEVLPQSIILRLPKRSRWKPWAR